MVVAIFLTGYFTTGSRENLLTVVAVVGVLPAAKSLIACIMIWPHKSQTKEAYDEVCGAAGDTCVVLTELVLTTTERIMPIDFIVVKENHIVGFASNPKCDIQFTDKFLTENMQLNGHKVSVKIMNNKSKFLMRVKELADKEITEEQVQKDSEIAATVLTLAI
ncbi:MAG: hypothetical protein IKK96_03415 [Lachnospiraceae bacterium]|nr:hypothetical protein [Lachnospiraceae bacterium]